MKILKIKIGLLLLSLSGFIHAQTLEEHLKIAAENNPGLKAKFSLFEAAMEKVSQVNALPDPTLSFGYFISPVETRVGPQQAKFSLSQMFPWFGTLAAKGEMTSYAAQAKYHEFLEARNELFYQVKAAWYPIYEAHSMISLQRKNRDILATYKQLSMISFKNGKSNMVDIIRADIMLENANTDIDILEKKLKPLIAHFNNLQNQPDTLPVQISDSLYIPEISDGYRMDSLLVMNPILEAYDLKLQSAMAQEELAKKQGAPALGVGLDYVIVGDRSDVSISNNGKNAFMPMISMSLPIFRGKYNAAVNEAKHMQAAVATAREDYENNLQSKYEFTWFELVKAHQLIELYSDQMIKSNQVIKLLLSSYQNSGKDFEEILRMHQELLKYQMAHTAAVKNYMTALAKLDYLTAKTE